MQKEQQAHIAADTVSQKATATGDEASKMPPVFVISLARAAERRASIAQRLNAEGIKFEFVDAVDGAKINMADYADRIKIDYSIQKRGRGVDRGSLGCYLSHYQLWERIVREQISYALVLEDDAVWNDDFFRVVCEICACEWDWDVTLLHRKPIRGLRRFFGGFAGGKYRFCQSKRHPQATVAYLITADAAKRLCGFLYTIRRGIDEAWRPYYCWQGRFYRAHPPVADFSGAESTVDAVAKETNTMNLTPRLSLRQKIVNSWLRKQERLLLWFYFYTCRPRKKSQHPRAQKP